MVPYQKVPPAVVRVVVERAQPWCRARVIDGGLVKVLSVGVAHLGARNPARLCPVVLAAVRRRAGGLVDARAEKLPRGCTFVPCGPDRAAFLVVVQQLSSPPQLGGARLVRGIQAEAALGAPVHGFHAVDVAFATIELALLERARLAPPRESPCPLWRWRRHSLLCFATSCRRGVWSTRRWGTLGCTMRRRPRYCLVWGTWRPGTSTWSVAAARLFMPVKFVLLLSYLLHTVSGLYFCARGAGHAVGQHDV